eukprot:6670776-Pyramimonas_sp.AAC.1
MSRRPTIQGIELHKALCLLSDGPPDQRRAEHNMLALSMYTHWLGFGGYVHEGCRDLTQRTHSVELDVT